MPAPRRPVVDLLTDYRPGDDAEAADVARVLELARSTTDPWTQEIDFHLTASALVVQPSSRRVLLRWHARQQAWLQVGGHGDPGENEPVQIARREGLEETGLTDLVGWPDESLVHVVVVPVPAKGDSPAHEHADLRFLLATEDPDAARPEHPDAPLRWLSLDEAADLTSEANLRETIARAGRLLRA